MIACLLSSPPSPPPFSFNNVVDAYGKEGQLAHALVQSNASNSNSTEETTPNAPLNEVGHFDSSLLL